jgi:hypothetical protein
VYNSRWEFLTIRDYTKPDRFHMVVNSFRQRYTDSVALSRLPGTVIVQMLLMGIVSLYQIMSHRRSVLLTQIWAYRCQNGHMQAVYLAQVTYHLVYNSDAYLLGLTTGTLTVESLGNLVFCFFAFSYCTINMVKARSGDQRLDRYYRLTWEAMQPVIVGAVAVMLYQTYRTPLSAVLDLNGEMLRKTTARGRQMCNLSDSCIVFTANLVFIIAGGTALLGLTAASISYILRRLSGSADRGAGATIAVATNKRIRKSRVGPSERTDSTSGGWIVNRVAFAHFNVVSIVPSGPSRANVNIVNDSNTTKIVAFNDDLPKTQSPAPVAAEQLTSFERNCLGNPFERLFFDCGDIAYVMHRGRRCSSVESVLLSGFIFHGHHLYRAQGILVLLAGRWMPERVLCTFNLIFTRWYVDFQAGIVDPGSSCPWHLASADPTYLADAIPLA